MAFLAATILPAQSELGLAGLVATGNHDLVALIAAASIGNTLGAVINWILGRGIESLQGRSWFPVKPGQLARARRWYGRYGRWSLLASWVPVVGDPLTVVAGVLREPLWSFLLIVGFAKTARYITVAGITLNII
jgi:membrane protein YqaA with SNARE-associated domain